METIYHGHMKTLITMEVETEKLVKSRWLCPALWLTCVVLPAVRNWIWRFFSSLCKNCRIQQLQNAYQNPEESNLGDKMCCQNLIIYINIYHKILLGCLLDFLCHFWLRYDDNRQPRVASGRRGSIRFLAGLKTVSQTSWMICLHCCNRLQY